MPTDRQLTVQKDYLDKWAAVSLLSTLLAIVGYFVYMMHNGLVKSPTDYLVLVGIPMGIFPLLAYFSTSEILGCRKFHRPRALCLKRFIGRVFLSLGFLLPVFLFLALEMIVGLFDSSHVPFSVTLISGWSVVLGWCGLMVFVMKRFREAICKLTEGLW